MIDTLPDTRCPECSTEDSIVPTVAMTHGGPDRLLAVCIRCGFVEDAGPIEG